MKHPHTYRETAPIKDEGLNVAQWLSVNAPWLSVTERGIEATGKNSLAFPVPASDDPQAEQKLKNIVARLPHEP